MIRAAISELRAMRRSYVAEKDRASLDRALKDNARQVGEAAFNSVLASFYRERADDLDASIDWWPYAEAMQKWHDHETAAMWHNRKADECAARVSALRAKLGESNDRLI